MTDDLATRLRALLDRVPDSDAVIIDKTDMLALLDALTVRDAVVAEALAVPAYWTPNGATDGVRRAEHMRSILAATGEEYVYAPGGPSRVPQGAAEPWTDDDERDWERPDVTSHINRPHYQPWTDPKPWIDYVSSDRRSERPTGPDAGHYAKDPRSREQYDAEEGNRG